MGLYQTLGSPRVDRFRVNPDLCRTQGNGPMTVESISSHQLIRAVTVRIRDTYLSSPYRSKVYIL